MSIKKTDASRKWKDKIHFRTRVNHWTREIGVEPKRIILRSMKNKWASCSTKGFLTFNSDLLNEDLGFGEYVIVHELLHLKIPNHGKLFKSLLGIYMQDYKEIAKTKNRSVCGIL